MMDQFIYDKKTGYLSVLITWESGYSAIIILKKLS